MLGDNDVGQLGQGRSTDYIDDSPNEMGDYLPAVSLGTGRSAKAIALGGYHTCALIDDASVKCWGANEYRLPDLGLRIFSVVRSSNQIPEIWHVGGNASPTHILSISRTPPCKFRTGHPSTSTTQSLNYLLSLFHSVLIPAIVVTTCGVLFLVVQSFFIYIRQKTKGYVKFASCSASSIAGAAGNVPVANAPTAEFGSLLEVINPMYAKVDV